MAEPHNQTCSCSTQSTHTAGPWIHIGDGRVVLKSSLADYRLVDICDVTACDKRKANAELIAAAPDMLAALVVAREFISTDRNALADCSIGTDGTMEQEDAEAVASYDGALLLIDAALKKASSSYRQICEAKEKLKRLITAPTPAASKSGHQPQINLVYGHPAKTVVFSAPEGWGKTRNAPQLAAEFGCKHWRDGWAPGVPLSTGCIHFTNVHPSQIPPLPGIRVVNRGWEGGAA